MRPLLAMTILITGCSVHDVRAELEPRVEMGSSFSEGGEEAVDRWWEEFGDPELTRVIDATLDGNLTLRMAWARLDQMRAVARGAGAPRYPTADLTVGGERRRFDGDEYGLPDDTTDSVFASLTVRYEVDLWKKISNGGSAALRDLEATRQDVEATALALAGAAGEIWFGIAAEQARLHLLDEQMAVGQEYLDLVEGRFARGLATAVDVFQQRMQLEATRNRIPSTTSRLATGKHQFAVLLGREPRARTPLPEADLPDLPPLPATGVPLEVLRARPDVRAAELRAIAADHRLAVAIADRYPSLSISATAGGQAEKISDVLDRWLLNLAGNLLAPVFDGGRRAAEADRNRAVVEERIWAWQAALLGACAEVEDALVIERGLRATREILGNQIDLAGTTLERSRAQYVNGLTDYLTVLTALQSLQELQRQAISNEQELLGNRIRLYLALGGSWSRELEEPA